MADAAERYDYVIVGGGTAGCVLACRLTEDPDVRVLVLEAGGAGIPANVDVPPLWYTLLGSAVDWGYRSVPQPALGDRRTAEPRGKLPGGSSDLNLMMHVRGHPSDFDDWAYHGAPGWSFEDVLPYFRRTEEEQPGVDAGQDANPTSELFLGACAQAGHPMRNGFNGREMVGAGWHRLDIAGGHRRGALTGYLNRCWAGRT
jgi:choline dehydrogenase